MKIFIIGYGNMGSAIAKRLLPIKGYKLFAASKTKTSPLKGIILDNGYKHLKKANLIIVAVKPQDIPALAESIKKLVPRPAIIISIAAGVEIAKIQKLFVHQKVVRIMPNLGLSVGKGLAGWKCKGLSAKEKSTLKIFLTKFTRNFEVASETKIDSLTAISGSGPAYFFYLAQSLYEAALNFGFNPEIARILVEDTFSAAALLQANNDYKKLISRVRSKKGTTDAALKVFDKYKMDKIIKTAVRAAAKRARELSNG